MRNHRVTVYLTFDLYHAIMRESVRQDRAVSQVVERLLREALAPHHPDPPVHERSAEPVRMATEPPPEGHHDSSRS